MDDTTSRRLGGIANRLYHDSPMAYKLGHTFRQEKTLKIAKQYRKELDTLIKELEKGN